MGLFSRRKKSEPASENKPVAAAARPVRGATLGPQILSLKELAAALLALDRRLISMRDLAESLEVRLRGGRRGKGEILDVLAREKPDLVGELESVREIDAATLLLCGNCRHELGPNDYEPAVALQCSHCHKIVFPLALVRKQVKERPTGKCDLAPALINALNGPSFAFSGTTGGLAPEGWLRQVDGVGGLVRRLNESGESVHLTVTRDGVSGEVSLVEGEVVSVWCGQLKGEPAFLELCSWHDGEYAMGEEPHEMAQGNLPLDTATLLSRTSFLHRKKK